MKSFLLLALSAFSGIFSSAQDSLIAAMAKTNLSTFVKTQTGFTGPGWEKITALAGSSDNILIGEDHFTNEIPFFFSAVASQKKFDNFFVEIDPWSAKILQNKITGLAPAALSKYIAGYSNTFSFFALYPEFRLLEKMVKSKAQIYGTDQVLLVADRLICDELQQETKNKTAKAIYKTIADSSKKYFDDFRKDNSKPFYMFTDAFAKKLNQLSALQLTKKEKDIIEALKITARIYMEQSHHLRIQLMKNQLMQVYNQWVDKKNLFKFGANHLAKGESLLRIYDIGNLVSTIADSRYKSSVHIMIVGKSGKQGTAFKGAPEQTVDENSEDLRALKPLFANVLGSDWHCFDMLPLRKELEAGKLAVSDISLVRIIKGYDLVVIIPEVTAAKFLGD